MDESIRTEELPKLMLLYDGDCGFCNRSVQFILNKEKSKKIHFAALQSDLTQQLFAANNWPQPDLSTLCFIENGVRYERSTAALRIARYFRYPARMLRVFYIIPRPIRDWAYNVIAKRRQRIAKGYCVMPSPEDSARFLR